MGIALERRLLPLKAIAATSIAYIVITMWRNEVVTSYLASTKDEQARNYFPSPRWPQFEYLAERLGIYASKHRGRPDLRPWYSRFVDPKRRWHAAKDKQSKTHDWRSRKP